MAALYVRVRVAGEEYALPVDVVLEVAELGAATPVPGAPPAVLGVRNLRGSVLPVVDLAAALGLRDDGSAARVVVVEHGGRHAALSVAEVVGVDTLPAVTQDVGSPNLSGGALIGGRLVGIVDVRALLDALQEAPPDGR